MEETKNVVTNENFDWNAFEHDLGVYDQPKEEIAAAYDKTLSNVNVGEVVEGTVTAITKREVLVNIGYKSEGVIPVSEFRYNPDLKVGDKVKGKVVVMADYGAFVEIAPGVEGLIHVSEMSWSQHLRSAQEFLKVGDEVEAVILTLDREERKMSLGIKQLTPDPWENIEVKYPVGTKCKAKVRNFTNFGVFVEIEEGIDGLIHISDLSWTKKIKHPGEFTQVGADIDVVVLEIDKENRRLSLGHKQLEENPWNEIENKFPVDSIHEGTITELTDSRKWDFGYCKAAALALFFLRHLRPASR